MNRRQFLKALPASVGLAASWRIGYAGGSAPQQFTIPTGVDTLGEVFTLPANPTPRDLALHAMYTVHTAKPYGVAPMVYTYADFLTLDRAMCGDYAHAQADLSRQFGLTVRVLEFASGFHGWCEVLLDGRWELFDSTTNVTVNQPMSALLSGVPRSYRMYYAPSLDPLAPAVFRAHLQEGKYPGYYSVPALRARLPFFGREVGVDFGAIQTVD